MSMRYDGEGRLAIDGGTPALPRPLAMFPPVDDEERAAVARTLENVPLTTLFGGFEIAAFEEEFAERMGTRHAIAVTSGTTALHTAMLALGIGPGDEVIVTPFSFIASVSVVVQTGATPVFADIDDQSLGLDVEAVRAKVTERTRALLPVHHSGFPVDMERLCAVAADHDLAIVEDCAASPGATVAGRCVGNLGTIGCFSFNIGKIMRTGEGGMVVTNDDDLATRCRAIRVNGFVPGIDRPAVDMLGCNYTMLQPMAAIGRVQVRRLDDMLARRRRHAKVLTDAVACTCVRTPDDVPGRERVHYELPFRLDAEFAHLRDAVVDALVAEHVPAGAARRAPLYDVRYLRPYVPRPRCERAERAVLDTFFIDPRSFYSEAEVAGVATGLRKVLDNVDRLAT